MRGAALVVLVACGARGAAPPSNHANGATIASDDEAIRAFQLAWQREVRPTIPARTEPENPGPRPPRIDPLLRAIDDRMQAADALGLDHAEPHACSDGVKLIEGLDRLGHDFVLHGTVAALRRQDRCWAVLFLGGAKIEVHGWLDTAGRLLVV